MKRIARKKALIELTYGILYSNAHNDCNDVLHDFAVDLVYLLTQILYGDICIKQKDIDDVLEHFNKNRVK